MMTNIFMKNFILKVLFVAYLLLLVLFLVRGQDMMGYSKAGVYIGR